MNKTREILDLGFASDSTSDALGPRIRQISHKFNFSLLWCNLLSDCFFRQGLPPFASKLRSRNKLKSPANIIGLLLVRLKFSNVFVSSENVVSWSFSVLALYQLIEMNSVSSINASITKICPCLSDAFFVTVYVILPKKAITTLHKLDLPLEWYIWPLKLSFHLTSFSFVECVSSKNEMRKSSIKVVIFKILEIFDRFYMTGDL